MFKFISTLVLIFVSVNLSICSRSYSDEQVHFECELCLAGFGVSKMCTETEPTICTPCADGYWAPDSPHLQECAVCAKCGDGLYEEFACTSTSDTRCDSCGAVNPVINRSYLNKCLKADLPRGMQESDEREVQAIEQLMDDIKRQKDLTEAEHRLNADLMDEDQFWQWEPVKEDRLRVADEWEESDEEMQNTEQQQQQQEEEMKLRVIKCFRDMKHARIVRLITTNVWTATLFGVSCVALCICVLRLCRLWRSAHTTQRVIRLDGSKYYAHLTDQDNQMIKQCADHLSRSNGKYTRMGDGESGAGGELWWEEQPVNVHENPLYHAHNVLNKSTDRLIPGEP